MYVASGGCHTECGRFRGQKRNLCGVELACCWCTGTFDPSQNTRNGQGIIPTAKKYSRLSQSRRWATTLVGFVTEHLMQSCYQSFPLRNIKYGLGIEFNIFSFHLCFTQQHWGLRKTSDLPQVAELVCDNLGFALQSQRFDTYCLMSSSSWFLGMKVAWKYQCGSLVARKMAMEAQDLRTLSGILQTYWTLGRLLKHRKQRLSWDLRR